MATWKAPCPVLIPVLALILGIGSHAGPAWADAAETEFRLKAVGVSVELRGRIRTAIDGGVRSLRRAQNPDGDGHFTFAANPDHSPGLTALCGLAGRHAGTPEGMKVAAHAARWLAPSKGVLRREAQEDVYNLSLSILLLDATGADKAALAEPAALLGSSQSPSSGWWGYSTPKAKGLEPGAWSLPNLSTTQFAGLALWAVRSRGANVDTAVWRRHLHGLLLTQGPFGSWAYEPNPETDYSGYPCGTFMGVANLELALAALGGLPALPEAQRKTVESARKAAREALVRNGARFLESLRAGPHLGSGEGDSDHASPYYELFALEKACVIAGVERLGEVPWYAAGAELLLKAQNEDGGWGGRPESRDRGAPRGGGIQQSRPVDTAFALLFRVRAAEVYGTATPRPIDGGEPPTVPVPTPGK